MTNKILLLVGVAVLVIAGVIGGSYYKSSQNDDNLGYRENTQEITILNGVTSTAYGEVASVVYYRNVGITVATDSASGTLKFACSLSDTSPTFSGTQSATNTWDYIQVFDKESGASIDGDTGITLANTTDVRVFAINDDNSRWCTAILSGTVSGTTTVKFKPSDNQ